MLTLPGTHTTMIAAFAPVIALGLRAWIRGLVAGDSFVHAQRTVAPVVRISHVLLSLLIRAVVS